MTPALTQLPFLAAAQAWLTSRRAYLSPKTCHEYELNIKTLNRFFCDFRLNEISSDLIRAYQRARSAQCGPFAINHECSVLQQMLKRIGRWPEIAAEYQPLPLPKEKRGRVLRDEQRARLFRLAASNPNWQAAYLFALISVNTTAGPKETATLRLKDINLEEGIISIQPEGAKNVHRIRRIPLNPESENGVKMALKRARELGATEPLHYIFPFRINRALFDPNRHQTTFKTAWNKLIVAAGLHGFRMYDLRHHAITCMLENPNVSEETVEDIAGHISAAIKKQYSHVRIKAKREAVAVLCGEEVPKRKPRAVNNPANDSGKVGRDLVDLLRKLLKEQAS